MKKKFVLPSLFVLNAFLVGMTPKTSKAGCVSTTNNPNKDSVSYSLNPDSCYWLPQSCSQDFVKMLAKSMDSVKHHNETKDSVSYTISWHGGAWVKYTSNDGSGFIRTGGSRTWRNMNPGALRPGDFSKKYGACGSAGGFAVFPSEEQGMKALIALLQSDKYANLTIGAAIYKYAPPHDKNNTGAYQSRLSRMTGLSLRKKINQLTSDELDRVAYAIKEIEGWWSGKNESFEACQVMAKNQQKRADILKSQRQYSA